MKRRAPRGISLLLEAVVGFGLLATAMLLIFGIFPTSYQTMGVAKDRSMAINLARELLEERRVRGYFDPNNAVNTYNLGSAFGVCLVNGQRTETEFKRDYVVADVDDRTRRITVTVSWTVGAAGGTTGLQRSVNLETYVTPH